MSLASAVRLCFAALCLGLEVSLVFVQTERTVLVELFFKISQHRVYMLANKGRGNNCVCHSQVTSISCLAFDSITIP